MAGRKSVLGEGILTFQGLARFWDGFWLSNALFPVLFGRDLRRKRGGESVKRWPLLAVSARSSAAYFWGFWADFGLELWVLLFQSLGEGDWVLWGRFAG